MMVLVSSWSDSLGRGLPLGGVVMGRDKGAGIPGKGFLEDFSGVDRRLSNRPSKELLALNQVESRV